MAKIYYVTADDTPVSFAPETTVDEILQNIRTILTTYKGTVPLDRGFGISAEYLDKPIPVAEATMASEIMTAVRRYEPRARVAGVTFTGDGNGALMPRIEVILSDNYTD